MQAFFNCDLIYNDDFEKNKHKALFDMQKYDKCSFSVLCAAYSPVNHDENLIKTIGLVPTDLQYACAGISLKRGTGRGVSKASRSAPV